MDISKIIELAHQNATLHRCLLDIHILLTNKDVSIPVVSDFPLFNEIIKELEILKEKINNTTNE